jgi:putative zinc finger protein
MEREFLNRTLRPGPDCLTVDEIGRYADGALDGTEHARAATHIAHCVTCASELALLQSFASTDVRPDEKEIVDRAVTEIRRREPVMSREPVTIGATHREQSSAGFWPFGRLIRAMSMAVVLLIAAASYYLLNPSSPRLPVSVDSGGEVTRSLAVAVRGPVGDQVAVPERLEWQSVTGAVRYEVRVMEVDRRELWSARVTGTEVPIPEAVRARILPAKTLLWQVTALDQTGRPIAESGVERFRLAR